MAVMYLRQEFAYDKATYPWNDSELKAKISLLIKQIFEKVEQGLQLVKAEFETANPGCKVSWDRPEGEFCLDFDELHSSTEWRALCLLSVDAHHPDGELFDDSYLQGLLDDPVFKVIHEPLYSMDWSWLSRLNAELPDGQSVSVYLDSRKTVYNDRGNGLYTYHNEIVYP